MGTFDVEAQRKRLNQGWDTLGLEHPWGAYTGDAAAPDLYSSRFSWVNPTLRPHARSCCRSRALDEGRRHDVY